ncbi:hypothetical protein E2C01_011042 [Portunus trituberculatus]|uniref:Uncharacterized protein n=1 Tax=Portunus trituberculatus TaxID=210409 RepID=A0A5B7DA91_PORTR|nr:hypothetical protein [Portunus trituberculatus]
MEALLMGDFNLPAIQVSSSWGLTMNVSNVVLCISVDTQWTGLPFLYQRGFIYVTSNQLGGGAAKGEPGMEASVRDGFSGTVPTTQLDKHRRHTPGPGKTPSQTEKEVQVGEINH